MRIQVDKNSNKLCNMTRLITALTAVLDTKDNGEGLSYVSGKKMTHYYCQVSS